MMSTPTSVASSLAPPFRLVSKYFLASIVSFVALCALLLVSYADIQGHHFQPKLLALTHIATLGWISMIIFGALYQLIPVVLEVKLFSTRIAEIQFWIFSAGVIGMAYGFWFFRVGAHFVGSASLVTLAMVLFILNVLVTMARVTKWNLTGIFLLAALVYLAATAYAGLLLSINLGYPFISRNHLDYLKLHAHLGSVGWVSMVIMGVALKLIPMFGLSHGFSTAPAKAAFVLVNVGLIGTTVEWYFTGPRWLLSVYVLFMAAGLFSYSLQLVLIFRHRLRKVLDIGLKHSAVAFLYMPVSTMIGALVYFIEFGNENITEAVVLVYGATALLGFFSTLIVGQMYKIVPFLVWFHTFSDLVGKEPVPMLKDMFNEKLGAVEFRILNLSVLIIVASLLLSTQIGLLIGLALLLLSSLVFAYNIATVFRIRISYGHQRTNP